VVAVNDHHLTPEEFDDARFCDSYWVVVIAVGIALTLGGAYALTAWCGWTGREAAPILGAGVIGWVLLTTLVYVLWARARRKKRRGRA
jgi:hypothetical protein